MKLYLYGHDDRYAVEQMMMTLFPGQKPEYPDGAPDGSSPAAQITLSRAGETLTARTVLHWEGQVFCGERTDSLPDAADPLEAARIRQRILRFAFYDAGVATLGHEPPWGALTGVRPVKLPTRWMAQGMSPEQARSRLMQDFRVGGSRAELAMDCALAALSLRQSLRRDELSLYVGIPFCPSRCAYCSFISADVKGALALVEPYVDALCREIADAGSRLREAGLFIRTAYMGGGTPTTLSAAQLDRVLTAMERQLPMDRCGEFTVEAGRPDTITAEKLSVLKAHGIHRISINPQTMENDVLRRMGRAHTAEEIVRAMELAEVHYGGLVNMDLIAGLPGDTVEGFSRTLDRVLALSPDNITVHTLALKKGARLMEQRGELCSDEEVARMLARAAQALPAEGFSPYYLYRQKYMSGSFENVGWCRPNARCDYNIIMMEELQSVLSLGAGGITKLVDPATGKIRRLNNPKYPREYLDSREKISADKAAFVRFQSGLR